MFRKINTTISTILLLFQVNLFFSCTKEPGKDKKEGEIVADLWMRQMPPGVRTSSIYGKIENEGSFEKKIIGFESDSFARLELHESKLDEKGIMRMKELSFPVLIGKGEVWEWKPGSTHLMGVGATSEIEKEIFIHVKWDDGKTSVWKVRVQK